METNNNNETKMNIRTSKKVAKEIRPKKHRKKQKRERN